MLIAWAVPRFTGGPETGDLLLYKKNVLWTNNSLDDLAADIRQSDADVVTLQEVGTSTSTLMELLQDSYPLQISCLGDGEGSPAVLSRLPSAGEGICDRDMGLAALPVETDHGTVWTVSVHLSYPWPAGEQDVESKWIAEQLAVLERPVVVGGDFNNVPWSGSVIRIAEAVDGTPVGPWQPTRWLPFWALLERAVVKNYHSATDPEAGWIPVAIDHVIAPEGRLTTRPFLGSDHLGLLAQITLDRAGAKPEETR